MNDRQKVIVNFTVFYDGFVAINDAIDTVKSALTDIKPYIEDEIAISMEDIGASDIEIHLQAH